MKHLGGDIITIIIVYVDGIILAGNNHAEIESLKKSLVHEFDIKDLGSLKYFLGMEFARSRKGIVVTQKKCILNLLREVGMSGCKPIDTPIDLNVKLGRINDGKMVNTTQYQRLVGKLIYLSHIRPDIAFLVSLISQFMHA